MFRRIFSVPAPAWVLLGSTFVLAVLYFYLRVAQVFSATTLLYIVQPVMALMIGGLAFALAHGRGDRARHKSDKAFMVGSVLSIWFVLYFLSGLAVTYTHNAVVSGWQSIVQNIFAYGIVAVAFEYARHSTMLLAGRRNVVWFGFLTAAVFALQQMNVISISDVQNPEEAIKTLTRDIAPAIVSSLLLTYLAVAAGFASQLVYRLGIVGIAVLPPIVPKYDWYMLGVSSILVAVAVYIVIDRGQQNRENARTHRRHHPRFAFDVMFGIAMVVLAFFMTGVFTYKPVVIMSNSMVPIFSRGSIVVVQRLQDPLDIKMGDIIQYEAENKIITHRVVAIETAKSDGSGGLVFTTKGDNNPSKDPPVSEDAVVGIVRSTVPYVGYPTVWLKEASMGH